MRGGEAQAREGWDRGRSEASPGLLLAWGGELGLLSHGMVDGALQARVLWLGCAGQVAEGVGRVGMREAPVGKRGSRGFNASSRLMSSKCDRFSVVPMKSRRVDEWMLDDLDDFEFVRSGGLPGGAPNVCWASWA